MKSITTYTNINYHKKVAEKYSAIITELRNSEHILTKKERDKMHDAESRLYYANQSITRCELQYANYVKEEKARMNTCVNYIEYTTRANMSDIMDAYSDYKLSMCY